MPEATDQPSQASDATVFSPYLEQPVPDLASTLSTQAEEANDENISFLLRTELTDEQDSTDFDDATDRRRRMRRAVDAMVEPRVYTPAQLQELGNLREPSYSERTSRHEYNGWAPGASDDEEHNRQGPSDSHSSAAMLEEQILRRDEQPLTDRIMRRVRDTQHLEWRDLLPIFPEDPTSQEAASHEQSYFDENEAPAVNESSLRTTALLQAVRRNPRYLLDRERERVDDRNRTTSARTNEPASSNVSPSQRRQMHREATVRQELQQQRDLIAEHQQRRNYLEEQLRQQRDGILPAGENRRRRYWQRPSYWPVPVERRRVDDAIKYLGQLRLCESDKEGQETAEEGGIDPEELCPQNRHDFVINTQIVPPPPESSWLQIGGVLLGTQHGASSSTSLPSYTPLMPPSTYRSRAGNPHFGSVPPRTTSPTPDIPIDSSLLEEERWPVKVTIHSIDYSTMTLAGTMEAFNVPDKTSPTKVSSITTFLEGEIIDFNTFTLETKSFTADTRVDGMYWKKLPPFKDMSDDETMVRNLLSKEWLEKELMQKWILMRWKEKCFVTPSDAQTALTISGFYYISLRRENGHVEGLYYDPNSNPYQHLTLFPQQRTFPTYTFA